MSQIQKSPAGKSQRSVRKFVNKQDKLKRLELSARKNNLSGRLFTIKNNPYGK